MKYFERPGQLTVFSEEDFLMNFRKRVVMPGLALSLLLPSFAFAMAQAGPVSAGMEGQWQGPLQLPDGSQLRIVLKISRAADGSLTAFNYSIDQSPQPMRTADVSLHGNEFHYAVPQLGNSYDGKLSADGNTIIGKWAQSVPLNFTRATKETAWEIPEPAPKLKPMTEQNPSFAVATIKPSNPGDSGKYFRVMGRRWMAHGTTLMELIQVAYGLNEKQIVGAPAWASEERFDVVGEPDAEGEPNGRQWIKMVQKLITQRFALTEHREQREISSYVLTTGKEGVKNLTRSESNNPLPGLEFSHVEGGLLLPARNTTMSEFTQMLQQVVLDRPVLDRTGLQGRYDFELRFMPNETMFHGHPPVTGQEGGAAEPGLVESLARLGLNLVVEKVPMDVMVVDHVQRPSEN